MIFPKAKKVAEKFDWYKTNDVIKVITSKFNKQIC